MRRQGSPGSVRPPHGRIARLRRVRFLRRLHPGVYTQLTIQPEPQPEPAEPGQPKLQPVPSGQSYRVISQAEAALVIPALASELSKVLELFAKSNGFNAGKPLTVAFGRGTLGLHRFGRAADIYAIDGKGIGRWAREWNEAMRKAKAAVDPQERARSIEGEKQRNLGYKLYKALQAHGGWAQPKGFPVQLFGPWTRGEGPHKAISDQLLNAHRDHIHLAR
jgi:hypothetical protein